MNAYKDLVLETSTTTGTGTLTLAGAVLGHQAFSVVGDGATCEYLIRSVDPVTGVLIGPFEIGVGTYSASAHTLTRGASVSSNGGAAVAFTGTLRVSLIASSATLSTAISATSPSALSGVTYNSGGQVVSYTHNGVAYTLTYATVAGVSLPATKAGGGRTTTYSYNSSGQLTGSTVS